MGHNSLAPHCVCTFSEKKPACCYGNTISGVMYHAVLEVEKSDFVK